MDKPELIPSRGAIAEPLVMEVTRELTPEDLARLGDAPKVTVPVLQKLRATHHRQAQLLAQGKSVGEVAAIVGCTPQRLVQLQVDPAFAELVHYYHDQAMVMMLEDSARIRDKLVDVSEAAVDELRDRLDDPAKRSAMQTGNLVKIAELGLDRTVAPPKTAMPSASPPAAITINFGTPLRGQQNLPEPQTIDISPEQGLPLPRALPRAASHVSGTSEPTQPEEKPDD